MMRVARPALLAEKVLFLKRGGFALIALGLVVLTFLGTAPTFHSSTLALWSYLLMAVGGLSLALFKVFEIVQHSRLKRVSAHCRECGWLGPALEWYHLGCCPECDSEDITFPGRS